MSRTSRRQGGVFVLPPDVENQITSLSVAEEALRQPVQRDDGLNDRLSTGRRSQFPTTDDNSGHFGGRHPRSMQSSTQSQTLGRPADAHHQPVSPPATPFKPSLPSALLAGQRASKPPPPPPQLLGLQALPLVHTQKPLKSILKKKPVQVVSPASPPRSSVSQGSPGSATKRGTDELWGVATASATPSKQKGFRGVVKKFLRQESMKTESSTNNAELITAGFLNHPTSPVPMPAQQPPPPRPPPPKDPRAAAQKIRFVEGHAIIPRPEIDSDPYDDDELEEFELPPSPKRGSMIWEKGKEWELDLSTSPTLSHDSSVMESPTSYSSPLAGRLSHPPAPYQSYNDQNVFLDRTDQYSPGSPGNSARSSQPIRPSINPAWRPPQGRNY